MGRLGIIWAPFNNFKVNFYVSLAGNSRNFTFAAIMKRIDLVKMNGSMLKIMAKNDIKTTDVSYIEVYDDFVEIRKDLKFSVVITELAEKYVKEL